MTLGRAIAFAALASALGGCGASDPIPPDCTNGRCDAATSKEELLAQLGDSADPIAELLRAQATEAGTLTGDYNTVLDGLGDIVGCDASTERSFVVLSNADFIPKTVFARCADSPTQASRFFVAAPLATDDDMDPRALHLTAWDEEAKRYNHYATNPAESGEMSINVSPGFCLGCHGGPEELDVWQPLMNEMVNPWSGWNAEPGFQSQLFDEFLDLSVASGPVYGEMLSETRVDSASNLEPLIRAGIARTVSARVLSRNSAADTGEALDLLRPLFCEETVNYVSEVHDSGELRIDALVDQSLRDAIVAAAPPGLTWSWVDASTTLLPQLADGEAPVTLIATRATISVEFERALLARQVLTAFDLLRVRSIDWQNPFDSAARCDLYRVGRTEIESGALDAEIAALPGEATTAELMPIFFNHMVRDQPSLTPTDVANLGDQVEAYISAAGRDELRTARDQRGCDAAKKFSAAPIIPDLACP